MKILIMAASRYGSTLEAAGWIAERLGLEDGVEATMARPADDPDLAAYDAIILGSGIYADAFLPELSVYITANQDELKSKPLALFGVAYKPEMVFVRGKAAGGIQVLEPLFERFDGAMVHAEMLGGQFSFAKLSEADQKQLLAFFEKMNFSDDEIASRKAPLTKMNKADFWHFAEEALAKFRAAGNE